MRIVSLKKNETVHIGDEIKITVAEIRDDKVRIGIDAPDDVGIYREEVYDRMKKEGKI